MTKKKRTVQEICMRIDMVKAVISTMIKDPQFSSDPRAPETIKHYRAQQLELEKELYTIIEPKPVQIGLQPGRLIAKPLKPQEK